MKQCCYNCIFYDKLCYMPNKTVLDECCDVCTLDSHTIDDACSNICTAFSDNKGSAATDNFYTRLHRVYEILIKERSD